ncbi:MAG: protoporphyrinogen oxidase [Acidobacteriia bacterium]|nr:protoporphyrinogen oxidase [Terriglobia bacterium]
MKRIAIVGGGISGLAAAFALDERRRAGEALQFVVYESGPRFGGVLFTEQVEGCLIEAGPDSFLTEKPWAADLCRRLGIEDQLIGSNDGDRKTYILVKGRLVPMPDGLMFMVPTELAPALLTTLFSAATKLRVAREWWYPARQSNGDESVGALVERHYGAEMVDRLADPLLAGVYGGEASQLSARAVLPRFVEMESKYGSLGRGMLAARKNIRQSQPGPPIFSSLKGGMQQLAEALVGRLSPDVLRANSPVQAVQRQDRGWVVSAGYASDQFDGVIVATPANAAAPLLEIASADLASELRAISYSSSVTVALGFGRDVRATLPAGFGFLVPRREGKRLLAATFVHNKFPHRAPIDRALVRCFLGGSRDDQVLQLSDQDILEIVREELRQILGLKAEPLFARTFRWRSAMAQYAVGHLDRLQRIEGLVKQLPGLALAGNGYRGIGVPDCIRSGEAAVQQLLS